MVVRSNGLFLRVLLTVAFPSKNVTLLPLWVEAVRVGNDCETFCKVSLRRT